MSVLLSNLSSQPVGSLGFTTMIPAPLLLSTCSTSVDLLAVHGQVSAGFGAWLLEVCLERRLELAPRHVFAHLVRLRWRHARGEDRIRLHARAADVRLAVGLLAPDEERDGDPGRADPHSRALAPTEEERACAVEEAAATFAAAGAGGEGTSRTT
jgi:hypothetical protein